MCGFTVGAGGAGEKKYFQGQGQLGCTHQKVLQGLHWGTRVSLGYEPREGLHSLYISPAPPPPPPKGRLGPGETRNQLERHKAG